MNTDETPLSPGGKVIVYESPNGEGLVDVRFDRETVWLTQRQMAEVFQTSVENINMHLRGVYDSGELDESATIKDFLIVRTEGQRTVRRQVGHYNLDAIISVGYRVNSKRAVSFRQWATRTLRHHLLSGYTLNESRLAERGLDEMKRAVDILARTLRSQANLEINTPFVLDVITAYSDTWRLLLEYDEGRLSVPDGTTPSTSPLDLEIVDAAIGALRQHLTRQGAISPLFGKSNDDRLEAILGNINQTMFGESLYQSHEEKAANLLYFVVKDHPFIDGNKRIGALLFLIYMKREGIEHCFDTPTLTAITLLIAESAPSSKDVMIRLIMNLMWCEQVD